MRIITSKTDEAISNDFNRRGFLKLAGSAGFGVVLYSSVGSVSLALGPTNMPVPQGFKDFLSYFGNFAIDLGMKYLGSKMSEWLPRYPTVQQGFNSFLSGLNGYSPYSSFNLLGGYGTTFFPIRNPADGLYMMPFFNQGNGRLGSGIEWYSAAALPQVNRVIGDQDNLDQEDRAKYLVPREPRKRNWQNRMLPERYTTDAGSTEFQYKGDENEGEVTYNIWAKESSGTLEKVGKTGKIEVKLER